MDLRQYLQVAWRRKIVILLCLALGAGLAAWASVSSTPSYSATAQLLLLPRDPTERVTDTPGGPFDLQRYVAAQVTILQSQQTATTAAASLEDVDPDEVLDAVSAEADTESDIVFVTATDTSPDRAAAIANAVTAAYIEDRRQAQVESLRNAAEEIGVQLDALSARIATLRAAAAAQGGDNALAADLDAANLQFTTLYGRQQDLLIDSTLKRGEAVVVEPAEPPTTPDGRSLPVMIVLGALLGGVVGLGVAYLRDQVDDRLRSADELEALTGLPVLAEIPPDPKLSGRDVLASEAAPMGPVAESFRALRTGVSFLGIDDPISRVLVTSAVPGEGKTFVAANFAASCAQAGFRTVLVSADLRRPRVESYFRLDAGLPGLTQILAARLPGAAAGSSVAGLETMLEQALQPTSDKDLFVLPSGPCPPNPAEMLASPRMTELLLLLGHTFDITILDTSPVGPVADALALAPTVGNVLLVTSQRTSRRREVERMTRAMARTNARILGVTLNRAGGKKKKGYGTEAGGTVYGDKPVAVPVAVAVPSASDPERLVSTGADAGASSGGHGPSPQPLDPERHGRRSLLTPWSNKGTKDVPAPPMVSPLPSLSEPPAASSARASAGDQQQGVGDRTQSSPDPDRR